MIDIWQQHTQNAKAFYEDRYQAILHKILRRKEEIDRQIAVENRIIKLESDVKKLKAKLK